MKTPALHVIACTAVVAGTLVIGSAAFGQASSNAAAFVKKWDRSGKGKLDMKAILNAAIVKFEFLDKDHTGRLTQQELAGEITPRQFRSANPDGDNTIGAEEWFNLVRRQFHAANPDHDGSLTLKELETPMGEQLLKLL